MDEFVEAIDDTLRNNPPSSLLNDGSVLTGWTLVTSWIDAGGVSYLVRINSRDLPKWMMEGMLFDALHGAWLDQYEEPAE